MPLPATCPECHKRFRVPHDRKEWKCKDCDVVLELEAEDEVSCPECDAPIEAGAHFCEGCGASLGGGDEKAAKRKKAEEVDAGVQMREARKVIVRLQRWLSVVLVFRILGLASAIFVVFAALSPTGGDMGLAVLVLGLVGLDLGLLILVRSQLSKRPFPAALTLASIATLTLLLNVFTLEAEGLALLISLGIVALFPAFYWYVVLKAAMLTRLAEEFPDLFLSKRMRGEHDHRTSGGRGSVNQHSRERIKRDRKPPYVILSVLGVLLITVIVYGLMNRPSSPEEVLDSISQAWNEKDFNAVSNFVASESREKWVRNLEKAPKIYDWGDDWPAVLEYSYEVDEDVVSVDFLTEAGSLPFKMRWSRESEWTLYQMSFRDVKDWKQP
ncbi:MAG: hypothetical protein ACI835_002890 [Planctomycetota bacterium]|jgi:hypothetical protein